MELFKRQETREYFGKIATQLAKEIESMPDNDIVGIDIDEWKEYYYTHYEVQPIVLDEEAITQKLSETKIKQRNPFAGFYYEPQYYEVDGVKITYSVPFDGDAELLELRPSTYILTTFSCEKIIKPNGDEYGAITLSLEFIRKELEQQKDSMTQYVANHFEGMFSNYRKMINCINTEVQTFNASLLAMIEKNLSRRKERSSSLTMISQKLEIPLMRSSSAPNVQPIALKRVKKEKPSKPAKNAFNPEYFIPDAEYTNINNIIYTCGTAIEATAKSYVMNGEEEYRDIFLATLNTHYKDATGETFRKIGKTDIRIIFENKAAFIAECKIWRGEKVFIDAVQQLMSYSTWKDTKVPLMIFNKENKNFKAILEKIDDWVATNTNSCKKNNRNSWQCKFYRKDSETEIDLYIVAFDFHVDRGVV